jgi:hypothetical protein
MKKSRQNKVGHLKGRHRKPGAVKMAPVKARRHEETPHRKISGHHKPPEKTKGQSALSTAMAEDELEERRRLFAKARKGDKGAVARIYELYGARIYTTAQVKEVSPARIILSMPPMRKRAQRA